MNIEVFMYSIMTSLYNMNAPIVFKGALVLKAVQYRTNNPSGLIRETRDIDGDWIGTKPSMLYLTNLLQSAVLNSGYSNIIVVAIREYGERKSAGFIFRDAITNEDIVSMDLSIRSNTEGQLYSFVNGISFIGQNVNKIVTDKIIVVSSSQVMRRVKDIIDLYILSYSWCGYNTDIINLSKHLSKHIDTFEKFINSKHDLAHAYSRYKNKASVLDFNLVYNRVYSFLSPFIVNSKERLYWDGDIWIN